MNLTDPYELLKEIRELRESNANLKAIAIRYDEENNRLEALNAELLAAGKGVCDAFDAGVFVRDVSHDHESDWAIKAFPHLRQLGKLSELVAKAEHRG